jgi:hypothetical protein
MNRNQMIAQHYYRRLEEDEAARKYFEEQKKKQEEAEQLTRQEEQIDLVCDPLPEVQEVTLIEQRENFFIRIINKLKFWKR